MITYIFIILISLGTLIAFNNWRNGIFLIVLIGALQDPVRKLTPGVSPLFVLSTLPLWMAVYMNVFLRERKWITLFSQTYSVLNTRIRLFLAMIIPAALVLVLKQNIVPWQALLLGAFGYVGPMVGMVIGFAFAQNRQLLIRFLGFYCFVVAVMLIGTVLEYMNIYPGWEAIGTGVMAVNWIKYVSYGHTIYMKSGFYRSPDIMGWHGSMMTMITITLFFSNSLKFLRWIWLTLAVWGILCVVISGRYKMVAMPMVWGIVFAMLVFRFRGGRQVMGLAIVGVLVITGMNMLGSKIGLGEDFILYASSPVSYSVERVDSHGVNAVISTFRQSGFWGRGLGTATQGVRYTGKGFQKGWQEGGLSKIAAELGMGGLFFFFLLSLGLLRALWSNIKSMSAEDDLFYLYTGMLCIIAGNGAAFVVSSQIYGDLNILFFFSLFLGFVLSRLSFSALEA